MATISNLFVDAGATYSNIITVSASNGQPLDLTGYTVASQMRKSYQSSTAYNFTTSISNPIQGRVRIELSSEQSRLIPAGKYLYDVEVTAPTGEKTRVVEGMVLVREGVTKI